jgi:hypothetical protein
MDQIPTLSPKRRDELRSSRFSSVTDNVRLPKCTPNHVISLLPTDQGNKPQALMLAELSVVFVTHKQSHLLIG